MATLPANGIDIRYELFRPSLAQGPSPERAPPPTFAAAPAALLRALGIERAHVGGVSMGGMVTAQFAVDYPEMCESVLLVDTTCGNGADAAAAGDWERQMQTVMGIFVHLAQPY